MLKRLLPIFLTALVTFGCDRKQADPPAPQSTNEEGVAVYFKPKKIREAIVRRINDAKNRIYVQAYSFTSDDIARALVAAHKRGVKVTVILDAEKADKKSEMGFLSKRGIDTYIDSKHDKAHNKIILIDGQTVITGSFNFNDAPEDSDTAENVLVIHDKPKLVSAYEKNFHDHLAHSEPY